MVFPLCGHYKTVFNPVSFIDPAHVLAAAFGVPPGILSADSCHKRIIFRLYPCWQQYGHNNMQVIDPDTPFIVCSHKPERIVSRFKAL